MCIGALRDRVAAWQTRVHMHVAMVMTIASLPSPLGCLASNSIVV